MDNKLCSHRLTPDQQLSTPTAGEWLPVWTGLRSIPAAGCGGGNPRRALGAG